MFQTEKVRSNETHTHCILSRCYHLAGECHRRTTEVPFSSYFNVFADYAVTYGSEGGINSHVVQFSSICSIVTVLPNEKLILYLVRSVRIKHA